MSREPKVAQTNLSVIVPCYNSNTDWLVECLSSVYNALMQYEGKWELLVIDDGSKEPIQKLLSPLLSEPIAHLIQFVRQTNSGLSAARNTGIHRASGEWCHFIDDDDMILPSFYQNMFRALVESEADLVFSESAFFGATEQEFKAVSSDHVAAQIVVGNVVHVNAVLAKRERLLSAGLFDETLNGLEDWDMWLRCLRGGAHLQVVQKCLARVRVHPGSMSTNRARMNSRMAELSCREWRDHFEFWQARFPSGAHHIREWALAGLSYAFMSEQPWHLSLQFRKAIRERLGRLVSWALWIRQGIKHMVKSEASNHAGL